MILDKATHCYACNEGRWSRRIAVETPFIYAIDRCNRCTAYKRTILMVGERYDSCIHYPGDLCGAVSYGK